MEKEDLVTKQLEERIKELEIRIDSLEYRIRRMSKPIYRYQKSPFDRLYVLGNKMKNLILNRRKSRLASSQKIIGPVIAKDIVESIKPVKTLPSITVVIPTYKPNDYIDSCVKSVLEQDYAPEKVEVIVSVNGANEDYAKQLEEKYKNEKRVRVIYTPTPGAGSGRNNAISHIRTDFVTYLDDDDYLSKGFLKLLGSCANDDVSIVCGKIDDVLADGTVIEDTYLNKTLRNMEEGKHSSYHSLVSVFSSFCAKLYRSVLVKEVWGEFDESLSHTEDVVFWVENINKPMGKIAVANAKSPESYCRRVTADSRSRPNRERSFAFYITDRLDLIERISKNLLEGDYTLEYRYFVLAKIDAAINFMVRFFENECTYEEKEAARKLIFASDCPFINKSLFAKKEAIAFCHNFAPAVDASAFVASKRLAQISKQIGEPLSWTVVCADMSKKRSLDILWEQFYAKYQYSQKNVVSDRVAFDEESQYNWGEQAFEQMKDHFVPYIYSRSMWAGSHVAAWLYKKAYPETIWIAEFSDPVSMNTDNLKRQPTKIHSGSKSFLNTFWQDIEQWVFDNADQIIFTNENQKKYMLDNNPPKSRDAVESKAWVWHHPRISDKYANIIVADYSLDDDNINIGYFGTFYANRSAEPMFELLKNPKVHIHIFTQVTDELKAKVKKISDRIHLHELVSQFEVLNIASRLDYLFLNDIEFNGEINPYLPSKLSDYLAVDTFVIALVREGTPLSLINDEKLLKFTELNEENVNELKKNKYSNKS